MVYGGAQNWRSQDPSTVPPEWHGWLHAIADENPTNVSAARRPPRPLPRCPAAIPQPAAAAAGTQTQPSPPRALMLSTGRHPKKQPRKKTGGGVQSKATTSHLTAFFLTFFSVFLPLQHRFLAPIYAVPARAHPTTTAARYMPKGAWENPARRTWRKHQAWDPSAGDRA